MFIKFTALGIHAPQKNSKVERNLRCAPLRSLRLWGKRIYKKTSKLSFRLSMDYNIKPIGVIHSSLKKLEDCPLQENENAPEATIEVFAKYKQGIKNIKAGSKLIVLT